MTAIYINCSRQHPVRLNDVSFQIKLNKWNEQKLSLYLNIQAQQTRKVSHEKAQDFLLSKIVAVDLKRVSEEILVIYLRCFHNDNDTDCKMIIIMYD